MWNVFLISTHFITQIVINFLKNHSYELTCTFKLEYGEYKI